MFLLSEQFYATHESLLFGFVIIVTDHKLLVFFSHPVMTSGCVDSVAITVLHQNQRRQHGPFYPRLRPSQYRFFIKLTLSSCFRQLPLPFLPPLPLLYCYCLSPTTEGALCFFRTLPAGTFTAWAGMRPAVPPTVGHSVYINYFFKKHYLISNLNCVQSGDTLAPQFHIVLLEHLS